jgi:hypothetical protein
MVFMEKIKSIVMTPYELFKKNNNLAYITNPKGEIKEILDDGLMDGFEEGDFLFESKMVGEGFVQFNYKKMTSKEKDKYFPEPADFFKRKD